MSTDRELLELAAKAAGMSLILHSYDERCGFATENHVGWWDPLTDDGDALRLAVRLGIIISYSVDVTVAYARRWDIPDQVEWTTDERGQVDNPDLLTATRRAIVRAAAKIGRSMP